MEHHSFWNIFSLSVPKRTVDHWFILLKCLDLFWILVGDDDGALCCSVFACERLPSVAASRSASATAISARIICNMATSAQVGD